jgi:hypothetical protein
MMMAAAVEDKDAVAVAEEGKDVVAVVEDSNDGCGGRRQ